MIHTDTYVYTYISPTCKNVHTLISLHAKAHMYIHYTKPKGEALGNSTTYVCMTLTYITHTHTHTHSPMNEPTYTCKHDLYIHYTERGGR